MRRVVGAGSAEPTTSKPITRCVPWDTSFDINTENEMADNCRKGKLMAKKRKEDVFIKFGNNLQSNLLDVAYLVVDDPAEIKAMERGENGWKEASVESRGLVRCTAPINGTVYRIRTYGGLLDSYYSEAAVTRLLGSKKGRVFLDAEGKLRVVINLSKKDFEQVITIIAMDTYELSRQKDGKTEN